MEAPRGTGRITRAAARGPPLRVVGSGPDSVSQGMVPELTSGQASVDRSWLLLWGQAHCTQYDPRGPPQPRHSPADSNRWRLASRAE
jgi:hypothetical protein